MPKVRVRGYEGTYGGVWSEVWTPDTELATKRRRIEAAAAPPRRHNTPTALAPTAPAPRRAAVNAPANTPENIAHAFKAIEAGNAAVQAAQHDRLAAEIMGTAQGIHPQGKPPAAITGNVSVSSRANPVSPAQAEALANSIMATAFGIGHNRR